MQLRLLGEVILLAFFLYYVQKEFRSAMHCGFSQYIVQFANVSVHAASAEDGQHGCGCDDSNSPLPTPGGHCSQVFEVTFLTLYLAFIILWLRFVADDGRVSEAA